MEKIVAIVLILFTFLFQSIIKFGFILTSGYSEEKESYYQSVENRIKYFEDNEELLNNVVDYFHNYPNLNSIDLNKTSVCTSSEDKYVLSKKINICVIKDSEKIVLDDLENILINLKDIVYIENEAQQNYDRNNHLIISFYIMHSLNGVIRYTYFDDGILENVETKKVSDRGIYEINQINDKWISMYDSVPAI